MNMHEEICRSHFVRRRSLGVQAGTAAVVLVLLEAVWGSAQSAPPDVSDERGKYFAKKIYTPKPLPKFEEARAHLPSPIYEENPLWVATYWKAWELAFRNFYEPQAGSGFVSQFIDAAFNPNIFLWDTCFLTMFCKYAHPLVPGIESLDNFYARQHEDGEICREIRRSTGEDYSEWVNDKAGPLFSRWGWNLSGADSRKVSRPVKYVGRRPAERNPKLTLDALNHPIFAWAELESFRLTGDRDRLALVWEPLARYYLLQGNGLYITDWASMDNSPRNQYLIDGGTGVDISSEMVLFARQMAEIATILGRKEEAQRFSKDADRTTALINQHMWDESQGFYFDLSIDGQRTPVKTIGAYWTLLSKVASRRQAEPLVSHLKNPRTFGRSHRVPSCSADAEGYTGDGGYWRGAVWAPTNTMVIRGLQEYGYGGLAREIALEHVAAVADIFKTTGTIWENYAPDSKAPGKPARRDFVGWSGLGPIAYLIEFGIGLTADAQRNEVVWRLMSERRVGCERFRFNGRVVTLTAEPAVGGKRTISVVSDGAFRLRVLSHNRKQEFRIREGRTSVTVPAEAP
jgi:hypothetical protein